MRQEKLQRNKEGRKEERKEERKKGRKEERKAGRALITFQNCPIFSQNSDNFGNALTHLKTHH
jgi:hypothetical protein